MPSLRANALGMAVDNRCLPTAPCRAARPQPTAIRLGVVYKVQVTDNISVTQRSSTHPPFGSGTTPSGESFRQLGGLVKTTFQFDRRSYYEIGLATNRITFRAARSTNLHNQFRNGFSGEQPLNGKQGKLRSNRTAVPATVIWLFQVDKSRIPAVLHNANRLTCECTV